MKKLNTFLIVVLISSLSLTAQNKDSRKADKHFDRLEFVDAAKDYLQLVTNGKGNAYVYAKLAECYYNIFNTTEAERWFAKALETSDNPELVYKYSQMLKANGKYDESNAQMDRFASMRPGDDRATAYRKNPDYLPKILEKGKKFNVQNLPINTEVSDFGGTISNGKLYITSARNYSRKTYGWNGEPFLDVYQYTVLNDGSYGAETLLGKNINSSLHEGLVSFSPDGKTMYFSRDSHTDNLFVKDSLTRNKQGVLNLYRSTLLSDGWSVAEPLPFNSKSYSVKNPSVSSDGSTLYFASDMPGGYGYFDIYKVSIEEDGKFGNPENLGQKVNTEGQEMFPFISSDGTLYFSSDGHLGLGGLDVFFTREIDGKIAPIRNVGVPLNSNADDFAIRIDEESGKGFVSSNRAGGIGSDDIYSILRLQPLCDVLIAATVTDSKTGNPINGAMVSIVDDEGNKVNTKVTSSSGLAEFMIECETDVKLEVTMEDYESTLIDVAGTSEEEVMVDISLDPIDKIIIDDRIELNPIYFDFDKSNITAKAAFELDKLVQIMNKYPEMTIKVESHTDSRGSASYNQGLSDRRAKTTVQYVISKGVDASRISGEGKGESDLKVKCGSNCTEEEHQENRRSDFIIASGNPNS